MTGLESDSTTGLRMTNGNAGITGKEFSPIGSAKTLGKDGTACDFSVVRKEGDSLNRGLPKQPTNSILATGTKKR